MGKYPDTVNWHKKGVLSLAYPMYIPPNGTVNRFLPVWQGWINMLLKGISRLPQKKTIKVLFMGRNSPRLVNQVGAVIKCTSCPDPAGPMYIRQATCPFKEINSEIDW